MKFLEGQDSGQETIDYIQGLIWIQGQFFHFPAMERGRFQTLNSPGLLKSWLLSRERNILETPKLVGTRKVAHPTGNNAHQFRCQSLKGQGRKITRSVRQLLADMWRSKRPKTPKLLVRLPTPRFQGQKVKVTRSTNAETGSASYLPNGKAYELETWYADGGRRPVSPASATTSKVKGQRRKVMLRG